MVIIMNEKKKRLGKNETVLEEITNETTQVEGVGEMPADAQGFFEDDLQIPSVNTVKTDAEEEISFSSSNITETVVSDKNKSSKNKAISWVYDIISTIVGAFVIVSVIFVFLFRIVGVDGESMTNTLQNGDLLLAVNKSEYVQGDIVVITQDTYFHTPLIKRVIAVGGQTIDIDYDTATVYVDGIAIDEPYVKEDFIFAKMDDCNFPYTVPEGKLFCMGDNRNGSTDSRSSLVGPIDERQIMGKAIMRFMPFGDFDIYDYQ